MNVTTYMYCTCITLLVSHLKYMKYEMNFLIYFSTLGSFKFQFNYYCT